MSLKRDIALLSRMPLFDQLGEDKLRLIAFSAERLRIEAGQTLFREGAPADCAYVVITGVIALSRGLDSGKARPLGSVGRGALLGEIALISAVSRHVTAVAEQDSELFSISRPFFHRMVEEYPEIAALMRQRLLANVKDIIGDLQHLAPRLTG